jgi:pSer/pThr/pTyr-binding forkhead associated (FHA) protein
MGTYNGRPSAAANNTNNNNATGATNPAGTYPTTAAPASSSSGAPAGALMHRIRLVPHLDTRRSLRFDAISRDLREGDPALRIGRFTDRSGLGLAAVNALGSNKLAFRSKVVSRAHAEIWVELGGKFYVKDTKSSSGTFLNHVRLSPANTESRPCQIKDGDILQLGVDYQGGAEDIYKSVKIRIELGREWQASANAFKYVNPWLIFFELFVLTVLWPPSTNALKNLKSLALPGMPGAKLPLATVKLPSNGKSQIPDCCICLYILLSKPTLSH